MVLFASYSGAFGGAERLLVDFARGLDPRPALACPAGGLERAAREAGLTVFELPARSLRLRGSARLRAGAALALARHGAELRRLVRDLEPELLVAWGMRSAIAATALPTGLGPCPVVFQHNDFLPAGITGTAARAASKRAALTIALSHAIAAELDDPVTVVHPGIEVARFDAARQAHVPPHVLVLGAIMPWKRPDLAIEACALAGVRVRIVGAPLEGAEAYAASLRGGPEVELPGPVADPAGELASAFCLLHCAEREPFGMAVLEALAAGRPVVAPAAGGPREIVEDTCGVLYAPGDAQAAAAALRELLGDPQRARRLGAAGRERAEREFGLTRAQARYREALAPLLATRRPRRAQAGLALVTVTHNSERVLPGLLESVRRHLPGSRLIVVDCASSDETVPVAGSQPFVEVIELGENAGFGRGCNRGLREVDEPVTALVNPDVELVDGSLLELAAEALRRDRGERLLAPLVLYPDGSRQDTVHPVPASVAELVHALVPPGALPGPLAVPIAPWRSTRPRRVGWAVGCALVAQTATLRALGPFDERFFLYGEDLELGLRAAEAGVESWFWPRARVVHHRAHATANAFGGEPFALLADARHDAVLRRLGPRRARLDDATQGVTFATRATLKLALGRSPRRELRQLRALRRATR